MSVTSGISHHANGSDILPFTFFDIVDGVMMKRIKILKTLRSTSFVISAIIFLLLMGVRGPAFGALFFLLFIFLAIGSLIGKAIEELKQKERVHLIAQQKDDFYRILEAPENGIIPSAAMLKSGETGFIVDFVNMSEVVTERIRAYTGTRLKLGSAPIYLGGGKSVANEKWGNVAYGELVLTSFRLIFIGDMRSIDLPLAKINGVEQFTNGIRINQTGRSKPIFFTVSNPQLWQEAIQILASQ